MTSSTSTAPASPALAATAVTAHAAVIQVYAIDERPIALRGLQAMLGGDAAFAWAGGATTVGEALAALQAGLLAQPDVVLIQHRPPQLDGLESIAAMRPLCPRSSFLLISQRLDAAEVRRALDGDVAGVLPAAVECSDLTQSVQAAYGGQRVVPPVLLQTLARQSATPQQRDNMTPRELRLLELMARGMDNRAISLELGITVPTVKFHITNIMGKLQASNRTAAVVLALRLRLVSLHADGHPQADEPA